MAVERSWRAWRIWRWESLAQNMWISLQIRYTQMHCLVMIFPLPFGGIPVYPIFKAFEPRKWHVANTSQITYRYLSRIQVLVPSCLYIKLLNNIKRSGKFTGTQQGSPHSNVNMTNRPNLSRNRAFVRSSRCMPMVWHVQWFVPLTMRNNEFIQKRSKQLTMALVPQWFNKHCHQSRYIPVPSDLPISKPTKALSSSTEGMATLWMCFQAHRAGCNRARVGEEKGRRMTDLRPQKADVAMAPNGYAILCLNKDVPCHTSQHYTLHYTLHYTQHYTLHCTQHYRTAGRGGILELWGF